MVFSWRQQAAGMEWSAIAAALCDCLWEQPPPLCLDIPHHTATRTQASPLTSSASSSPESSWRTAALWRTTTSRRVGCVCACEGEEQRTHENSGPAKQSGGEAVL